MGNLGSGSKMGSGSSNIMPGRGLINPAFVIKIVAPNDDLQQSKEVGRNNPSSSFLSNLNVGKTVSSKIKGEDVVGTIKRLIKNSNGDVISIEMMDSSGNLHTVLSTSISPDGKPTVGDETQAELTSSPAMFNESNFLTYNEHENSKNGKD